MAKVLNYKGIKYHHGDLVEFIIDRHFGIGRINTDEGSSTQYYLCQDVRSGACCVNRFGYKYSWTFSQYETGKLSDNVEILKKVGEGGDIRNYGIIENNQTITAYANSLLDFSININSYPSCCGSRILNSYSINLRSKDIDSTISELKKEKFKNFVTKLKDKLVRFPHTSLIVRKDDYGHKFFTKVLGFEEGRVWRNWNDSNRELLLLEYFKEIKN